MPANELALYRISISKDDTSQGDFKFRDRRRPAQSLDVAIRNVSAMSSQSRVCCSGVSRSWGFRAGAISRDFRDLIALSEFYRIQ